MPKKLKQLRLEAKDKAQTRPEDVDFLFEERLGLTPSELELKQDLIINQKQEKQIASDIKKLKRGVSPQYILGYSWFYGYKIRVSPGVLIPRFETEELVNWALANIKGDEKVLDLGTGSGCITVALGCEARKAKKQLNLYASDITDSALRLSEENFLDNDLDVTVRKANVLVGLDKFDVIISNPPYIKPAEKKLMDRNVLQNEPKTALFGGNDGLEFYRRFAKQVREHLHLGGEFYLEFGFAEQPDLKALFAKELPDFKIEFRKDMAQRPRMVHGKWQKNEN